MNKLIFSNWLKDSLSFIGRGPFVWFGYAFLVGILLLAGRISFVLGLFFAVTSLFVGVGIAKYIDLKYEGEAPVKLGWAVRKSLPLAILPLSDYLGRKKTIIISNIIITCCLALILLAGESLVMLYIAIGGLAVFYGATFPIYGACAGDYFPRELMGTVIGAWTPFYGLGAILTHWVTGLLRDATGVYNHAFVINVVMGATAALLFSMVRKK